MKFVKVVSAGAVLSGVGAVIGLQPATISTLVRDLERVEAVREIKDIQRTFAQFAQFGKWNDMAALFSDNGTLSVGLGTLVANGQTISLTGRTTIADWLESDAGSMDGSRPGSLSTLLNEDGLVSLSPDGLSAKVRWNCLRFMGDGAGKSRIQGGIYENEYILNAGSGKESRWEISLLRYYPMYEGNYSSGWRNTGKRPSQLPIIPYHFTPDGAGVPVILPETNCSAIAASNSSMNDLENLAYRINRLNEEDEVRNLQHSYGYYVDRRMWPDVVDLLVPNATAKFDGVSYSGISGIRQGLEGTMGPEGLTQGILNEHLIFDNIVEIGSSGQEATTRGIEISMLGDANKEAGFWRFSVFRNHFIKDADSGIWKIKTIDITNLLTANYSEGWAHGGINSTSLTNTSIPAFLNIAGRSSRSRSRSKIWRSQLLSRTNSTKDLVSDLRDRLARSAAVDETENVSAAYGYYADDIRCSNFANLHAQEGFKESPFVGWYWSPERIDKACQARYNATDPNPMRSSVPFHWRLQPVVYVSKDGKSTSLRTRLLQFGTSNSSTPGFNVGMYHDQLVLEDLGNGTTRRKLWSLTLDEFYVQSVNWTGGWATAKPQNGTAFLRKRQEEGINGYVPDVALTDPKLGEREVGLIGGSGQTVVWPGIQRVWWSIRNPVSGRVPQWYWAPGCVPCRGARPDWTLTVNGYQEPPTGPTLVSASVQGTVITVNVIGGPEELVTGVVELWREGLNGTTLLRSAPLDKSGAATFAVPASGLSSGANGLSLLYPGNEQLKVGRTWVTVFQASVGPVKSKYPGR